MRPTRPTRYINPEDRLKNKTPISDAYWNKCVNESIDYDGKLLLFMGNARKELISEAKKENVIVSEIDKVYLTERIKYYYEYIKGRKYDTSEDGGHFLELIIDYIFDPHCFLPAENKFEVNPLIKNKIINTVISRDKGLFIVGNYGTGKTSLIEVIGHFIFNSNTQKIKDIKGLYHCLNTYRHLYSAMNLVTAHTVKEASENKDKSIYAGFLEAKIITIDDIFAEDKSYGKEILKQFLEQRYSLGLKTSLIMNYSSEENSLEETLSEYGIRYGNRLMDRLFEMCNIVEVKGKSKRK